MWCQCEFLASLQKYQKSYQCPLLISNTVKSIANTLSECRMVCTETWAFIFKSIWLEWPPVLKWSSLHTELNALLYPVIPSVGREVYHLVAQGRCAGCYLSGDIGMPHLTAVYCQCLFTARTRYFVCVPSSCYPDY